MTCRQALKLATYRCSRCGHDWRAAPTRKACCPECGELYVTWTNYDHEFARIPPRAIGAVDEPSSSGAVAGLGDGVPTGPPELQRDFARFVQMVRR